MIFLFLLLFDFIFLFIFSFFFFLFLYLGQLNTLECWRANNNGDGNQAFVLLCTCSVVQPRLDPPLDLYSRLMDILFDFDMFYYTTNVIRWPNGSVSFNPELIWSLIDLVIGTWPQTATLCRNPARIWGKLWGLRSVHSLRLIISCGQPKKAMLYHETEKLSATMQICRSNGVTIINPLIFRSQTLLFF